MRTSALVTCSLLLIPSIFMPSVFAAPVKGGADPVAEGFPAWTGVSPKNYIYGRVLASESDLRQRVATVVIEFDATKSSDQLEKLGTMATMNGYGSAASSETNWETVKLPRDIMVIYVARNGGKEVRELVKAGLKDKAGEISQGRIYLKNSFAPIYENVTFDGAPENGGKLPFVYVMGFDGKEPLLAEAHGPKTTAAIHKVIAAQRKKMAEANLEWRPFYGYVAEPKHFKDIEKALAKGKPLRPVEMKLKKSVTASDAEKAREAQMLYDALEQTKSDYLLVVNNSWINSPHVAAYNMGEVLKYWPEVKKQLSAVAEKLKAAGPGAKTIIQMYPKVMQWANPEFLCKNAGEAKKIVAELEKMKKALAPIKEDASNIKAQNGALVLEGMLDELIAVIPNKVVQK